MIVKILAFVLLSLGALAAVGILGVWFPGVKEIAGHIGQTAITYGNILFLAAVSAVVWITSKV